MVCKVCGAVNDDASRFCQTCGADLTDENESTTVLNDNPVYEDAPVESAYSEESGYVYSAVSADEIPANIPAKGLSIASLILGIVSIVFCICGGAPAFNIAGLVMGNIAKKKQPEKYSVTTAGVIINAIMLPVSIIVLIVICAISFAGGFMEGMYY